jgi:hypothetical protein
MYLLLFLLPIAFMLTVDWRLTKICKELKRSNDQLARIHEKLKQ